TARRPRISVVERGRVRNTPDQPLARQKPNYGLAPGLLAREVKQLEARVFELLASRCHRVGVLDLELDAGLRDGQLCRPRRRAEARLRGLGQRPDAEVLAAGDLLAVPVLPVLTRTEREAKGLNVELAALRRVVRDRADACNEKDLHGHPPYGAAAPA